jgi:hypothetical protein
MCIFEKSNCKLVWIGGCNCKLHPVKTKSHITPIRGFYLALWNEIF